MVILFSFEYGVDLVRDWMLRQLQLNVPKALTGCHGLAKSNLQTEKYHLNIKIVAAVCF